MEREQDYLGVAKPVIANGAKLCSGTEKTGCEFNLTLANILFIFIFELQK